LASESASRAVDALNVFEVAWNPRTLRMAVVDTDPSAFRRLWKAGIVNLLQLHDAALYRLRLA